MKKKGSKMAMRIKQIAIVALILVAFVAPASAATLTVTPSSTGAFVSMEGTGFGANEEVTITSSVTGFKIPVSGDGIYAYSLVDFNISQENTSFSLSVREVENDPVIKLKRFTWTPYWTINKDSTNKLDFVFDYDGNTNTSTVTRGMPTKTGVYHVFTVTGTAVAGPSQTKYVLNVSLNTTLTYKITTNATGGFKTVCDTHGIPAGTYTVTATNSTVSAEDTLTLSLCGDGNKDGDVGAYDCVCIARYVIGTPGYDNTTMNYDAMDVDDTPPDGVDIRDARYLARYLVGLETDLHCPE